MKKISVILMFFIISGFNSSIKEKIIIEPTELDSLYVRTLNNSIGIILSSGWKYIEPNEYGKRIKGLNVSYRCKFLSYKELMKLSLKERKTVNLLRLTHKIISKDTIDINISHAKLTTKWKIHFHKGLKFKKTNITIGCGGTNGYIPYARYVYNKEKKWETVK